MTRKLPVSADDVSMWDSPQESPLVRQLLRAGRVEQGEYDMEAGLARHLANLQSGAQSPPWAIAQSTVQKAWSPALLAWLLPPMISATVVGAWLYFRPAETVPAPLVPANAAPASAPASVNSVVAPSAKLAETLATAPVQRSVTPPTIAALSPAAPVVDAVDHELDAQLKARVANSLKLGRHGAVVHRQRAVRDSERTLAAGGVAVASIGTGPAGAEDANGAVSRRVSGVSPSPAATAATSVNAAAPAESPNENPPAPAASERREPEPQTPRGNGISDARLEREMQMLAVAQRVLSTDPERSLRLTRQGEHEFRGSMFSAERTQVSLLALVQLGRMDEARRLGASFLRAYPNAPWSARLREALATGRLPNSR